MPFVLVSTSPFRQQLLSRLGWEFEVSSPQFDEEQHKSSVSIEDRALHFSRGKALNPGPNSPQNALFLGGDQVLIFEGKALGKPGTREKALEQLWLLQGRTHELRTGACLVHQQKIVAETVHVSKMTMRTCDKEELEWMVDQDQPLKSAGSYMLEKHGISLFSKIECSDWTAIEGLPLLWLQQKLLLFQTPAHFPS